MLLGRKSLYSHESCLGLDEGVTWRRFVLLEVVMRLLQVCNRLALHP